MANANKASVVAKMAKAPWVNDFKAVYGPESLANSDEAFAQLAQALQKFQREDALQRLHQQI